MTMTKFIQECATRTISPDIALENNLVHEALKARDDKKVIELLDNEF